MVKVEASIGKQPYKTIIKTQNTTFLADQPEESKGKNLGPKPTEMLAGALASCVAMTVKMYADRKEWALDEVLVEVDYDTESKPGTTILRKKIDFKGDLTEEQRERLFVIAGKCPINKALQQTIEIE